MRYEDFSINSNEGEVKTTNGKKSVATDYMKVVAVILASSILAISIVLAIAIASIFIVSLTRSTFGFLISAIQFITEVITAVVAAITSGFTITCSILVAVTTSALILPASKIQGRVFVAFLIAGVSTASYIGAIFLFAAPKMGKELTTAVTIAAASSVAFAAAWAVGIMSLVEKETSNFGLKATNVVETVRRNSHRLLSILLKLNICIKQKDLDLGLLYSAKIGYMECFEHLLNAGADPDSKDSYENTPLSMACEHGSTRMIQMLLEKGVNVEMRAGGRRGTALHKAANWGYENCVDLLLKNGANTNTKDIMNRTPLMLACIHAPVAKKIMKSLIEHGCDVNALSNESKTALHYCCSRGLEPNLLIEAGSDLNVKDCDGNTPLHLASGGGHCSIVVKLLAHGSDAKSLNLMQRSSLHMAAMKGCKRCVEILFNLSVNDLDTTGHSPLWYSAEGGHYDAVTFFVRTNMCMRPSSKIKHYPLSNLDDPLVPALNGRHLRVAKVLLIAGFEENYLRTWLMKYSTLNWFEELSEEIEWFRAFSSNPKSLRHICRSKLRSSLGTSIFQLSSLIRFPECLQKFITLDDLLFL